MNYTLMKDFKIMVRGRAGVEWLPILELKKLPATVREGLVMWWRTREGAQNAADTQGAAVIPANQL